MIYAQTLEMIDGYTVILYIADTIITDNFIILFSYYNISKNYALSYNNVTIEINYIVEHH